MSTSMPAPDAVRPAPTEAVCRVCGGRLEPKWRLQVLGRHEADYYECVACGCLQIPAPHWLDEAYKSEGQPVATNPDSGRFCRNFSAYVYLRALNHAGFFSSDPGILDYGGGSGILTAMFRLAGFHCRQYDPFCPRPLFEPELAYTDAGQIPAVAFDLVTALEVFEHLLEPTETIRQLAGCLKPNGTLAVSTGLYDHRKHGPEWPYLSRIAGQHVTFYTRRALAVLGKAAGLPTVCLFPSDEGFLILFTRQERPHVEPLLQRAARHVTDTDLRSRWTVEAWDILRHIGASPVVQPLILPGIHAPHEADPPSIRSNTAR
jgi:SAM-dependent methyltransferase